MTATLPATAARTAPAAAASTHAASLWPMDPALTFLNHGSYGLCLRDVLDHQSEIRARMERDPVRFFKVDLERLMDDVRDRLGTFINCPGRDIAPVANATIALATILQNTAWEPGDEILVTDHEYSSGLNELARLTSKSAAKLGIKLVTAQIPFPIAGERDVLDAVLPLIGPRTKLVLISQITSATSLIFPVQPIVDECNRRGIDILVDGTHAPGQIPVDVQAMNPTYYVGSCHKWVSAPKGTGFLYVRRDKQEGFRTVVLSSRADKVRPERPLFLRDFDYMGTSDYTALLTVPYAIEAMSRLLPGGWPALMRQNNSLCLQAREIVCRETGLTPPAPESMLGSMASLILPQPDAEFAGRPTLYDDPLQDALIDRHRIQIPVWHFSGGTRTPNSDMRLIRFSAQIYNTPDQYRKLGQALNAELARERSPTP